jgi:hypothetical protein
MPRNAWKTLKAGRPRIKIHEWKREIITTPKGEGTLIEYGYLTKTRFRYYQQFIYPDGTEKWRYCLSGKFTREQHEKYLKWYEAYPQWPNQ